MREERQKRQNAYQAKPFKRQITVLCIIHKELDTFCNAVRLVPEISLGSSCRTSWPALQLSASDFSSNHLTSTSQTRRFKGLLRLGATQKLTQKLDFAVHTYRVRMQRLSILDLYGSGDQVIRCDLQPLVSIGVNGIQKQCTSFSLWFLVSTSGADLCLKIYNLKAIPKSLQGGM